MDTKQQIFQLHANHTFFIHAANNSFADFVLFLIRVRITEEIRNFKLSKHGIFLDFGGFNVLNDLSLVKIQILISKW